MTNYAICFSANNKYVPHFLVACYSFLTHNSGAWQIYLLGDDLTSQNIKRVSTFIKKVSPQSSFNYLEIDKTAFKEFDGFMSHLDVQAYYRILIPKLLPNDIKFALYLDCDLVVDKQLDLDWSAMHHHPVGGTFDHNAEVKMAKRHLVGYFNSGVLLLNLDLWRKNNYTEKVLRFETKYTLYADQDLLNEYFNGQWYKIGRENNVRADQIKKFSRGNGNPLIIHFMGGLKPWRYWLPYSWHYWKYLVKTPYWFHIFRIPVMMFNSLVYKARKVRVNN